MSNMWPFFRLTPADNWQTEVFIQLSVLFFPKFETMTMYFFNLIIHFKEMYSFK